MLKDLIYNDPFYSRQMDGLLGINFLILLGWVIMVFRQPHCILGHHMEERSQAR